MNVKRYVTLFLRNVTSRAYVRYVTLRYVMVRYGSKRTDQRYVTVSYVTLRYVRVENKHKSKYRLHLILIDFSLLLVSGGHAI